MNIASNTIVSTPETAAAVSSKGTHACVISPCVSQSVCNSAAAAVDVVYIGEVADTTTNTVGKYPVDIGIVDQRLLTVTTVVNDVDIRAIYKSGWPLPADTDAFCVSITESKGNREEEFMVHKQCFEGFCNCRYVLDGSPISIKPCRVFSECFMWGDIDPNWEYMVEGSVFGFRIVNPDCPSKYDNENYSSILKEDNNEYMTKRIKEEVSQGKILVAEEMPKCIHSIGAVLKKKDYAEVNIGVSIRPITDCSRGDSDSAPVNEYCGDVCEKFVYKTLDDVCDILIENSWLCGTDISDAYRSVHIYYGDRKYQGLRWDLKDGKGDAIFCDARLCFGMASGPFVFNCISEFIVRSMARRGCFNVVNYLDDFLVMDPVKAKCIRTQHTLFRVIRHLGFSISFKKCTPVATNVVFLGIEIDSVTMRLTLPDDKLSNLLLKLKYAEGKLKMTKQEVQSLAGSLAHASKVVRGGRCFSRRIYDLCNVVKKSYHKIRLSGEARSDIVWWLEFAKQFNGSAKVIKPIDTHLAVYSDSSFSGYAALHGSDWLMGVWEQEGRCPLPAAAVHHWVPPPPSYNKNINELEFWPVLLAAKRWGHLWENCELVFVTDNTQVMHMLNSGRSSNKLCMSWIREMFWLSVNRNFYFKSVYIPTKDNVICDALSRWGENDAKRRLLYVTSPDSLCCYNHL